MSVGSVVRIPLGGRKVRGFVTDVRTGSLEGLKELRGVSGEIPVFDERLLETLRWAAHHYVSPLAGILAKSRTTQPSEAGGRPGLARRFGVRHRAAFESRGGGGSRTSESGQPIFWLRPTGATMWRRWSGPVTEAGRSSMVVVATATEAGRTRRRACRHVRTAGRCRNARSIGSPTYRGVAGSSHGARLDRGRDPPDRLLAGGRAWSGDDHPGGSAGDEGSSNADDSRTGDSENQSKDRTFRGRVSRTGSDHRSARRRHQDHSRPRAEPDLAAR